MSSNMNSSSSLNASLFSSKLPHEIRDIIYEELGGYNGKFPNNKEQLMVLVKQVPYLALLLVSKQFKAEYEALKSLRKLKVLFLYLSRPMPEANMTTLVRSPLARSILGRLEQAVVAGDARKGWRLAQGEIVPF
jgi:hypothetical protein